MENTPEEIDNTVAKPTNPPIEVGGTGLDTNSQIVETGARRIDDNYPTPTAPTPEETPVDIGKIPGVKEVYIKPAATPAPNRAPAFVDPKTGKPLDLSMKKFLEDTMKGGMINQWIAKYELQGIDLEKEGALIEKKQSRLSAAKRKVVVALLNMRAQQRRLLADIGKELLKKDNPTDDELRALLDGVEDAHTNQEEATAAVLSNIVQKATAAVPPAPEHQKELEDLSIQVAEELPEQTVSEDSVAKEVMKEAEVEYRPGEETTKTRWRGVFSALELVENPKAGDEVNIIAGVDHDLNVQFEDVFTYDGERWNYVKRVEASILGEQPESTQVPQNEDGSIPLTIGE